ncbi:MAG: Tol-Pal system protein TolB [Hyphomonadaceae bacterium]
MPRRLPRLSTLALFAAVALTGPAYAQIVLGGESTTTPPGTTSGITLGGATSTPVPSAPLKLDPDAADAKPVAFAIADFAASAADAATAKQFAEVVRADLASTGLFAPVASTAYAALSADIAVKPAFADWTAAGVQALVVGKFETSNGSLNLQFRLYDVAGNSQLVGTQYNLSANAWRRAAHKTADDIYKAITGATGQFDTRIAYVTDAGDKTILNIMDQDGASPGQPLTNVVAMKSPRWSPDGYSFVYSAEAPVAGKASQTQQTTILYSMDVGRREPLAPSLTPQPNPDARFSADARFTIFSRKIGSNNEIVLFDLSTRKEKVLTQSSASEISPSLSPDRSKFVFVSGSTITVANADGADVPCAAGPAKTCSLGAGANPAWSPAGDFIAFERDGAIGVVKADGSGEKLLTSNAKDTHPAWSPNGRTLVFARESGGASKLWTIDRSGRNLRALSTPGNAYDPDWSPLLR